MLQSLVNVGVFTNYDYDRFMSSISTVTSSLSSIGAKFKDEFLKKYGHLRPRTYDIMSPRYDTAPDEYFDWSQPAQTPEEKRNLHCQLHNCLQ